MSGSSGISWESLSLSFRSGVETFASAGGSGVKSVKIGAADITTIVAYFVFVMGVGLVSMIGVDTSSEEGYFLAGRFMTWLPVGASLFATNIGSEHYVGLSGSGAEAGIGVGAFELNALLLLPLLGWVFIPVYMASGVGTLPEYMTKRYGGQRIRMMLSVVSLVMYIFTKNSVDMYSGALFIQQAIGWNLYLSVALLLAMTILSTLTGGLAAVIYTDTLQCVIMILGALVLFILGIVKVGGFEALYYKYPRAVAEETAQSIAKGYTNLTCGLPPKDSWQMMRRPGDHEMPWAGFVFGQTTSSLWYWCADQMMVQRVLAAKNLSHAQGGCLFCAIIKIIPMFAMVMPGMIARVLYPEEIACASKEACQEFCENDYSCSNIAYPKLVLGLMPAGLRGFMIAVMLSATMSDLSSTFNSASTLFTMDLYKHLRKKAGIKELMIVGRISVVLVVGVGIATIPLIQKLQGPQLFTYIQSITNYISPSIAAIYLVAILWPRSNEKGTFWSLTIGFVIGVIRMILGFVFRAPNCAEDDTRNPFFKIHYMYNAIGIFWIVIIINVVLSLATEAQDKERTIRTMFFTRYDRTLRSDEIPEDDEPVSNVVESSGIVDKIEIDVKPEKSVGKRIYDFLCGIQDESEIVKRTAKEKLTTLLESTSINQKRHERVLLSIGMIFTAVIGVFLLLFFTVPFDTEGRDPTYYAWT
ncbi:DgyrCDS4196 [Dimorphilus gyrociliatus]|uniref:DgyrCDS4196 n=1 Tax=Dimorphilus gyrociliatus TaxID=2664684 RepID=A0A7I8VIV6_9ANNE|nr:DgyrCDS4196 [Dimorphilus gyrociliatus]